jgi:hypothetical protein
MMVLFNNGLLLTACLLVTALVFLYGMATRGTLMKPPFAGSSTHDN